MRIVVLALFGWVCLLGAALAQSEVPERRIVVTRDVDFYGSDLQALFDTTLEACQTLCLANSDCRAFTFNTRSNACFPKSDISDRQPYAGAISAQVVQTPPEVLSRAATRAREIGFVGASTLSNATAQAAGLGRAHEGGQWSVEMLLDTVRDREQEGNLTAAVQWQGAALAQTDAADMWVDHARLLMDAAAKAERGSDKRSLNARALSASVNAYLRADRVPVRVNALVRLARALEANDRGRDMISALRLAEGLQPRDDVSALLEEALGKYGFRITGHVVDSDLASPRICAEFSEPLVKAGVDYTPFVRLPDQTLAVVAEDRRICVEGVEHGARYQLTFREGLPAASGEDLARDVTLTLYVRDRSPAARFPGRAYVLPRSADAGIPVETVNVARLDLTLRRISDRNLLRAMQDDYFGRPLSYYQEQRFSEEIAEQVWTGTGEVETRLNADITTRLPIGEVLGEMAPGIYALTAQVPGADPYDDPGATQWFVLSDLGLTTLAGTDGLHVFVRGLSDAAARQGVTVELVSRANRVLGQAETDAEGHALFAPGLMRGTDGAAPALVTVRDGEADMAFLSLTDPAFDLSDRGVEGHEPGPPVDVFLTTDRGAYRAGETVHATALVRDAEARAIPGLPVTAILTRPDGVEYARRSSAEDAAGGHVFDVSLGATVPRGTWQLALYADVAAPPLASRTLLVEDFVPERMDFDLALPDGPIRPTDTPPLAVEARYLFGAPAADLEVVGEVRVSSRTTLDGFPGYVFGRHDEGAGSRTASLPEGIRTSAAGRAIVPLSLPQPEAAGRPLEAQVTVRIAEGSGRPVERQLTRALAPAGPLIGIRPLFDGVVPEGSEAAFDVIAVDPELQPVPMQVSWTLNRVETRYQWYQLYGNWEWEPVTTRSRVASGEGRLGTDPLRVAAPVDWGQYELVVERLEGDYVAASTDFHVGWYAPADASQTPDTLDLSLDKPQYRSGETAMLRLVPRYAGTALVTVLSNRVIAMQAVEVSAGENTIPLQVTDDWGAGAYVTASVIRPMDRAADQNPARALGLAHAAIDPGAKALKVSLEAPEQTRPRGKLTARVRVDGVAQGDTARVTVAAVDLGILNLTGFASPDPSDHYFGQRKLGVEIRDIYGRLIDGMNGAMGQIRSGGDAGGQMRMQSPPPTEELVAFFSGIVPVTGGVAEVNFDLPEFNGTVRLMAVAWSETGVGEAEADVIVRDPVVVTASLPRFLAPGDESRLRLEIVHTDGPAGRIGLDVTADGLGLDADAVPLGLTLEEGGTRVLNIPITAGAVGDHALSVALTTPEGTQLTKRLTLGVRANDPEISTTRRFSLAPGASFRLDGELFDGFRSGTAEALVTAGPLARFDAPALIAQLDRYPYGCTEQVASQAMPMLYFQTVAQAMGLSEERAIRARVDQAVARILTRQAPNGAFGLWRADSGDFWLDAYVTDFLSRARVQGFDVPDMAFRNAVDNLRNRIAYAPDFDEGGEDIAYALMVLAREGAAAMGDLRYYADVKAEDFGSPLAIAQLGAALASYGDQTRADRLFGLAARRLDPPGDDAPVWRADYGSGLRDAAGLLSLAVEAGSTAVDRPALTARLTAPGRPLSTQEQSWTLLAARALVQDPAVSGISVDGEPVSGPFVRRLRSAEMTGAREITNTSATPTDITLTTLGVPDVPVPAGGYGYVIERAYFTMDGAPLTGPVRVGDRLVTVLTVSPAEDTGARLMVNDPLPAGLEIDNPNLLRSGDIRALDWLDPAEAEHSEFRADRFLAAVNWRSDRPFRLAYIVRAVSPGSFHHPAASVEDMYRPQYRARTETGRMAVAQ